MSGTVPGVDLVAVVAAVTTWLYPHQQLAFGQLADRAGDGAAIDAGVVGDGGVAGPCHLLLAQLLGDGE
jgi:hypothetical protein